MRFRDKLSLVTHISYATQHQCQPLFFIVQAETSSSSLRHQAPKLHCCVIARFASLFQVVQSRLHAQFIVAPSRLHALFQVTTSISKSRRQFARSVYLCAVEVGLSSLLLCHQGGWGNPETFFVTGYSALFPPEASIAFFIVISWSLPR